MGFLKFVIPPLTGVMVLDCVVLVFLILIQLPKKEAGAGLAFGGAATDALFGAGSGNVLTKITKYSATTFFVLAIVLSVMQSYYHRRTATVFEQKLQQASPPAGMPATPPQATTPPSTPQSPATPPASAPAAVTGTNVLKLTFPKAENTNLPAPTTTAPGSTNAPK
jgi:preprotein translocase subunit SecG